MIPALLEAALALSIAAGAGVPVAAALPQPDPTWIAGALATPPKTVVRSTRVYGTVTIDHAAHLERRTRCASCHGSGQVGKIAFTPQLAHDRCRGCHVEVQLGPTDCRGCHFVAPTAPAPPRTASVAASPAPGARRDDPSSAGAAPLPGAAGAPSPPRLAAAAGVPPAAPSQFREDGEVLSRAANLGLGVLVGDTGTVELGPSLELVGFSGRNLVAYTVAAPGGPFRGRTQLLVAAGKWFDVTPSARGTLMGVGGLDGLSWSSSMHPVLGVRGGVELRTAGRMFRTVVLTMAALKEVMGGQAPPGEPRSDLTIALTLGAGFPLGR